MAAHNASHQAPSPEPPGNVPLEEYFETLVAWWEECTGFLSSPSQRAAHPAYQKVLALGEAALPHIFREVERGHASGWYLALRQLTGASPVPREASKSSARVRELWLQWGRSHGYL